MRGSGTPRSPVYRQQHKTHSPHLSFHISNGLNNLKVTEGYVLGRFIKTERMKLLGKNSPHTSGRNVNLKLELLVEREKQKKAWSASKVQQNFSLTDLRWWRGVALNKVAVDGTQGVEGHLKIADNRRHKMFQDLRFFIGWKLRRRAGEWLGDHMVGWNWNHR